MKQKRQAMILSLIERYDIETQEELGAKLSEHGFAATQATISRDIRELGLVKALSDGGVQRYIQARNVGRESMDSYRKVLGTGIISMAPTGNLIVVKTVPGMAMAVAAALDNVEIPGLLGSIAGDDTIFLAVSGTDMTERVISSVDRLRRR